MRTGQPEFLYRLDVDWADEKRESTSFFGEWKEIKDMASGKFAYLYTSTLDPTTKELVPSGHKIHVNSAHILTFTTFEFGSYSRQ